MYIRPSSVIEKKLHTYIGPYTVRHTIPAVAAAARICTHEHTGRRGAARAAGREYLYETSRLRWSVCVYIYESDHTRHSPVIRFVRKSEKEGVGEK